MCYNVEYEDTLVPEQLLKDAEEHAQTLLSNNIRIFGAMDVEDKLAFLNFERQDYIDINIGEYKRA